MAFVGKEYTFVKQENFEEFVNSLGLPDDKAKGFINYHPNQKLVKDGDTLTLINPEPVTFKSGVPFDDKVVDRTCKTTCTLDGNTLTQVQVFDDGFEFKIVRDYTPDELVVTVTCNKNNGKATRYYKAV